jgi:hypothetical protein
MRADGVVVMPPAFDNDLGFPQRVEDFTVEQFVTQATSLTPIWRIASAMPWPCETRTSTCRSFVTISSGLCLFLGISVLLDAKRHTSSRTTSSRADQHPRYPNNHDFGFTIGLFWFNKRMPLINRTSVQINHQSSTNDPTTK